jgi:hypothetical protein
LAEPGFLKPKGDVWMDIHQITTAPADINRAFMEAWRADISIRSARRRMAFELIDCETPFDDLLDEWEQWKRINRALQWLAQFDDAASETEEAA